MKNDVSVAIVTYNRKKLLLNCINAILLQETSFLKYIFIIDNHSSDNTAEFLLENKIIPYLPQKDNNEDELIVSKLSMSNDVIVEVRYVRKVKNDGGAGGFNKGMNLAFEAKTDWIWLMDDDGEPDKSQLDKLLSQTIKYNLKYTNALVVNKDDREKLAFGLKGYMEVSSIEETEIIENYVNPFNGTLISRDVIEKVGFIKKEMFIWGDEREYTLRVKNNGFKIATIIAALHFHPKDRGITKPVSTLIGSKFRVIIKPKHLEHIFYRNIGYIEKKYANSKVMLVTQLSYVLYFLLKLDMKSVFKFLKYYHLGVKNKFNNEKKT
jgi:rhamnopyranosyl-N-acetylglucosaminyl-diphospho-decaprenol beta-1,3/1,4-galactofuranosyltransferase